MYVNRYYPFSNILKNFDSILQFITIWMRKNQNGNKLFNSFILSYKYKIKNNI